MPVRGTVEEAASLVPSDLLAQVEAARAGFYATGMKTTAPWVEDLIVHLVALAAFERNESGRMPQVDAFFELLIRRGLADPTLRLSWIRIDWSLRSPTPDCASRRREGSSAWRANCRRGRPGSSSIA